MVMFFSLQRKYTCKMKQHLISVSWNSHKSPSEMYLLSLLQISHSWGRGRHAAVQTLSLPLLTFLVFTGTLLEAFSCSWAGEAFSCCPSYFIAEPLQYRQVKAAVQIPFAFLVFYPKTRQEGLRTLPEPGSCLGVSQAFRQMGSALQHGQASWDLVLLTLKHLLRII